MIFRDLTVLPILSLLCVCSISARAASLDVQVLGEDGQPVPNVAVFIEQEGVTLEASAQKSAVMDQVDAQFVPHILVISKGTAVDFPNSDVIAHHVYSFSKPNNFLLPLYKGDAHAPVVFAHDGVVTLGCNIHDQMLGYIVVVDTDVFGMTDESGRVSLTVNAAASGYKVNIWNPRIRDDKPQLAQDLQVLQQAQTDVTFRLQKKLRAPHHSQSEGLEWSEY